METLTANTESVAYPTQVESDKRSVKISDDAFVLIDLLRQLNEQMIRLDSCFHGMFYDFQSMGVYEETRREMTRLCTRAQKLMNEKYGFEPGISYRCQNPLPGETDFTMTPV